MGLEPAAIKVRKIEFLAIFEWRRGASGEQIALDDARTAASRRAHLYRPGTSQAERNRVRGVWAKQLIELAGPYIEGRRGAGTGARRRFEHDVMVLRARMNEQCGEWFGTDDRVGYPAGFRVAHAQKSLALYLKHLWCMDRAPAPPLCPVDRGVLQAAGASPSDAKWTHVDSLEQYRDHIAVLEAAAASNPRGPLQLAEWELMAFKSSK